MTIEPSLEQFAAAGEAAGRAFVAFNVAFMERVIEYYDQLPADLVQEIYGKVPEKVFQIYYQNVLDGLTVDQYGIPRADGEDDEATGVCAGCWCNTCDALEDCPCFPSSDGITPPPCAACKGRTTPLKPCTAPACSEYQNTPEACKACWCNECGNFEACVVEKDGFDTASKPCPCDGCAGRQRWMPKEKPPCENFKE